MTTTTTFVRYRMDFNARVRFFFFFSWCWCSCINIYIFSILSFQILIFFMLLHCCSLSYQPRSAVLPSLRHFPFLAFIPLPSFFTFLALPWMDPWSRVSTGEGEGILADIFKLSILHAADLQRSHGEIDTFSLLHLPVIK